MVGTKSWRGAERTVGLINWTTPQYSYSPERWDSRTIAPNGHIIVIGDGIEDVYLRRVGEPVLNPETPSRPKWVGAIETLDGGALNVCSNLRSLDASHFWECPIVDRKYRVVNPDGETVLRFDPEKQYFLGGFPTQSFIDWILATTAWTPTLVIADYAKGSITAELLSVLADIKWQHIFIDTKRSPQEYKVLTDRFGHAASFLPNRQEYGEYKQLYDALPSVVRTESEDGVSYLNYGQEVLHVPSKAKKVVSVCGAGDTVTASVAAARHRGLDWFNSLDFAMTMAADVVGKPMTAVPQGGGRLLEDMVSYTSR